MLFRSLAAAASYGLEHLRDEVVTASEPNGGPEAPPQHVTLDTSKEYGTYAEANDALKAKLSSAYKASGSKWEWGGFVVEKDGHFYLSQIATSQSSSTVIWYGRDLLQIRDAGFAVRSYQHIHPGIVIGAQYGFSDSDKTSAKWMFKNLGMRSFMRLDADRGMRTYGLTPGNISDAGRLCVAAWTNC